MLAPGTVRLYGTWIPRSLKHVSKLGIKKIVSFGQQLAVRWLHDEWTENFFQRPLEDALEFAQDMSQYLGIPYDGDHFSALHQLGYLPVKVKALPEGIETPENVPHMTFINTVDGYAWLTLFLETILSALSWKSSVAATLAKQFRRNLVEWIMKTCPEHEGLIDYLAHDFSARGLDPFTMYAVGLGHATSFRGSDSIIVIPASRYFYGVPKGEVCINSVNASEHSVSTTCMFTMGELEMMRYWMEQFPTGILSMVMDTMDLTKVVRPDGEGYLVQLKEEILARDGKIVIRGDSSPNGRTPVDIICGHNDELNERELQANYPEFYHKGLIECLWDIFGGTVNSKGFKVLNPKIGGIYGDGINLQTQVEIYERLSEKGFAICDTVLGVGSFQYQMVTRDTLGWAAKGGWFETQGNCKNLQIEGASCSKNDNCSYPDCKERVSYGIYKDPMTDSGLKKSPRGLLMVDENFVVHQDCTPEQEAQGLLQVIYEDGTFFNLTTLSEVREKLRNI